MEEQKAASTHKKLIRRCPMAIRCWAGIGLILTVYFLTLRPALGADPSAVRAKQKAESEGYVFITSHDEIVEKAKREGKLAVIRGLQSETNQALISAFRQKYSFITDVTEFEFKGTEAPQRFILELQAGKGREWDAFDVAAELHDEFLPYLKKFDVLGMAREGILAIPIEMVDPKSRSVVSIASVLHVVAYNKKAISEDKVPKSWEDFLNPELKGKKFMTDIRPQGFAALAPGMGEQRMLEYARKIREQQPIWVRGTKPLTDIATGEGTMYHLAQYHSCMRAREKALRMFDIAGCKITEPVPVRLGERTGISLFAAHPHVALLWIEFQASATAQQIIDRHEPLRSSIYAPGSELNKLVKGKQLTVNDWRTFHNTERWMKLIVNAFGLPQAETR